MALHKLAKQASLLYLGHWLACFRHYLTLGGPEANWKTEMEAARGEKFALKGHAYLVSMYWVFTTMTTVGYGDVPVVGDREKGLAIFAMIVGGACFGYIMGTITSMLENFDQATTLYREKVETVKEYVYQRQFPPALGSKIFRYHKHCYSRHSCFDHERVYGPMPASLRADLIHVKHKALIRRVPFLAKSPRPFAADVAPRMLPLFVPECEFLFFEGEVCTHLFCLTEGRVRTVARLAARPHTPSSRAAAHCARQELNGSRRGSVDLRTSISEASPVRWCGRGSSARRTRSRRTSCSTTATLRRRSRRRRRRRRPGRRRRPTRRVRRPPGAQKRRAAACGAG